MKLKNIKEAMQPPNQKGNLPGFYTKPDISNVVKILEKMNSEGKTLDQAIKKLKSTFGTGF